jgi:hypothetical protein
MLGKYMPIRFVQELSGGYSQVVGLWRVHICSEFTRKIQTGCRTVAPIDFFLWHNSQSQMSGRELTVWVLMVSRRDYCFLLRRDAMQVCTKLRTFRRNILRPSSEYKLFWPEDIGNTLLLKGGTYITYMTSHPTRKESGSNEPYQGRLVETGLH